MNDDIAIRVENLSKKYRIYHGRKQMLKEALTLGLKKYHHDFWALKDVSFDVKKGETIGIIGQNGSGKSTLLQMIAGVVQPSSGSVTAAGRIASLLELGAGFNPEFTGRENIIINGALMGLTKAEVERRLPAIEAFADIGEFIDQPVKTYSSGMYVRLAFATATSVDPEILIVDEALSVGDMRFQQKCLRLMKELLASEKTILFVSHDMAAVKNLCQRVIWLKQGTIFMNGDADRVVEDYISDMHFNIVSSRKKSGAVSADGIWEDVSGCSSFGAGSAIIHSITLRTGEPLQPKTLLVGGERVVISLDIEAKADITSPIVGVLLKDEFGNYLAGINSAIELPDGIGRFAAGARYQAHFEFDFPPLKNGHYSFDAAVAEGTIMEHNQLHWVHDAISVEVANSDFRARMGNSFVVRGANVRIDDMRQS